jgi:hypothetical protein
VTWTRLDDNVIDHPKIVAVSALAELLFYRCCVYINRHHTKGFVPAGAIVHLARCSEKQALVRAAELVEVTLLHERQGGWEVHGSVIRAGNPCRTASPASRAAASSRDCSATGSRLRLSTRSDLLDALPAHS